MQSKNRKMKRVISGQQNSKSNSSKVAEGYRKLQIIRKNIKSEKVEYLSPKGMRLKTEGASEEKLLKYKKNRISYTNEGTVREKYVYHE